MARGDKVRKRIKRISLNEIRRFSEKYVKRYCQFQLGSYSIWKTMAYTPEYPPYGEIVERQYDED